MRKTVQINENWNFYQGELETNQNKDILAFTGKVAWENVNLPHTWNNLDGQDGGNDYYQGVAWYQKTIAAKECWEDVYIRFGAVSKKAEVWCNGQYVGKHEGGFAAFTFCLTPYLKKEENVIVVKADNSNELPIYPRQADFTFFGGIYREVEMIYFTEKEHLDVETFGVDGIFITPSVDGAVTVDVYAIGTGICQVDIQNEDGECVATSEKAYDFLGEKGSRKLQLTLKVPNVHRWNGTEDAYLYQAKIMLMKKEASLDESMIQFGFREFKADAQKGFFLNGITYPLRGVCRHQDYENMGWAITETEHLEDMSLIREIGANTIRLAHYQQAPFFYNLCDQNGMVVWAEIPFISAYDARKEADENLRIQMRELVLQNYNHPSICFWGIANEVGIGGETEAVYAMMKELNSLTKELDSTRLTTIANISMTKTSSPLFHITDIASYNEYKGWYEGTADDHGLFCDEKHEEIPEIPLAISEYGAESILSWHSEHPKVNDYTEEYQAIVHEKAEMAFESKDYLWATWLWNMFDFAADARDEGGCKGRNNKGLVTYDRKIKKQAFYFYKACWSSEPFVYICGKRFTKRAEDKTTIKVYSNQPKVELWINDKRISEKSGKTVFEFEDIELRDGLNEIQVFTPKGKSDTLVLEKVNATPEEYILKEEKNISEAAAQWFASIAADSRGSEGVNEIIVNEGFLSVYDSMEDVYKYKEGYEAVQEVIAKPMALMNPAMADRMKKGGAMSFHNIWNHISKYFPDEAIIILNERLNKIRK